MKKATVVLTIFTFFLIVPFVLAQEVESDGEVTKAIEKETADIPLTLPNPGLTPDSPIYFLDTLDENVGLALTFSPEKKAKRAFSYAEEKLAEAKNMADKGKANAAEKATKKHDEYTDETTENLGKAKALGKDVEALAVHVAEQTLKHQAVKARVYDKLLAKGNLNAAEAVKKSMEKSMNGHNRAVQAITNRGKKEELENKGNKVKEKVKEKVGKSNENTSE